MSLRIPSPKALTKPEAYLAYKAGILSRDELKQNLYNPLNNYEGWLAKWCGLLETYPTNEDGTPQCLTDEEGLLAYLCGVTNRYPASNSRPDDARISAYIRYLVSARYVRPDHPLNREEFYLSIIKTQFIPSGDPSSDIEIDGTAKAAFVDVKMYGDTAQQTYSGKNLLNYNTIGQTTLNGVTLSLADDGTITLDGTCSADNTRFGFDNLSIALDGTYTLSFEVISGTIENATDATEIRLFKSGYSSGLRVDLANTSASNTLSVSGDYVLNDIRIDNGVVLTNYKIKIQLEKSATATPFEPYVGGTPSPNPDYPQPIKTVTGLQTVEVQGKNVFNKNLPLSNIYYTGTGATATYSKAQFINYEVAPKSDKITMSYSAVHNKQQDSNIFAYVRIVQYDSSGVFISRLMSADNDHIFTLDNNTAKIIICVDAGEDAYFDDLQLEYGSSSTAYEPYSKQTYLIDLGDIELNNFDDIHVDYIWEDGDEWKIRQNYLKITDVGDSSWIWDATIPRFSRDGAGLGIAGVNADDVWNAISNKFIAGSFNQVCTNKTNGMAFSPSGFISLVDTRWTDEVTSRDSLSGTVIYCRLRVPTDTVITDQNLINQLNALKQGGAEEGTTYIKVNATDPNLPAKLYVEAPKYD